ncbi:MAG TPA: phosphotransferase [Candidatus Binatia bacterium]|nr:phosphotransferase [Candidatus Binatia bacterium]
MGRRARFENIALDEAELQGTVEALLTRRLGYSVKIARLERKPSRFATLFPAEVLAIGFENGQKISLFLKHLGPEQSDHPDKQCRDREVRVYEELLANDSLPVPKYYGSSWNQTTGRHEVFLEYVDDWNLRYHAIEHWLTAARSLGRLHAHFAGWAEKLLACEFLLPFNDSYFHEWANRALDTVSQYSDGLAAAFRSVVKNYAGVAEALGRQPVTLVHNDLSPKNVIADRSSSPARICCVDWEMAGVGCGLIDLAHLKYGLDPENERKMCAAYCSEFVGTSLLPTSREELTRVLAASELVNISHRLSHSKIWGIPAGKVAEWVTEAKNALSQI